MPINPLNGDFRAGIPETSFETFNAQNEALITGDFPHVVPVEYPVAPASQLAEYTVVGFNGSGEVVPAVLGSVAAVGVLMNAVDNTVETQETHCVVWRMGVFNPNLLIWDASYATDADKFNAFEGAPSPTAIIIRPPSELDITS